MTTQVFAAKEFEHQGGCGANNICGVVHSIQDMGGFSFLQLRTQKGLIQCICDFDLRKTGVRCEASVRAWGSIVKEPRSPLGFELHVSHFDILSLPAAEIPVNIRKKKIDAGLETELNLRPATLRNDYNRALFQLQEGLVSGFRDFLKAKGFIEIFSPKIVLSGAEGGANIFKMDYFSKKAYLAQSPQFYKQAMVPVYERVYEIGPVFRAEKHDTKRHLNEYISIDFEMGFIDSFHDLIHMETAMLTHCFDYLQEGYTRPLHTLGLALPQTEGIPSLKFADAKNRAAQKYGRKIKDPYDLEPEEERLISRMVYEEYGSEFVFITHYPRKKRPFYAMDDPADSKYTLSFDLLFRGLEITTGGQRIHQYDQQVLKMEEFGLDPGDFESYLMLHKYGCPPHGGLGMGLERLCMQLLGLSNIRQASLFPRDTKRLTP